MPLLPAGAYTPDVSDYEGQNTQTITNALPRGDGYGPFRDFAILSQALPATCRGAFYALKDDGSVAIFAGTSNRLYLASNSDYSWKPVSKVVAVVTDPKILTYVVALPIFFTNILSNGIASDPIACIVVLGIILPPTVNRLDIVVNPETVKFPNTVALPPIDADPSNVNPTVLTDEVVILILFLKVAEPPTDNVTFSTVDVLIPMLPYPFDPLKFI